MNGLYLMNFHHENEPQAGGGNSTYAISIFSLLRKAPHLNIYLPCSLLQTKRKDIWEDMDEMLGVVEFQNGSRWTNTLQI
jgi:hypothetical protein